MQEAQEGQKELSAQVLPTLVMALFLGGSLLPKCVWGVGVLILQSPLIKRTFLFLPHYMVCWHFSSLAGGEAKTGQVWGLGT